MLENLCTLPLASEVFTQAIHPTEPLLTVGLATGHVETFRLPAPDAVTGPDAMITSAWRTRRHKGSCRSLAYSGDGLHMFSAGTDGLVKQFSSTTGRVVCKIQVPERRTGSDAPTLLHVLNPQCFLLACDSGMSYIFDIRENGSMATKPAQTHILHDDYVSSFQTLQPLGTEAGSIPRQFISTGGTTLVATDSRRGIMKRSEDQEDELFSSAYVFGMGPKPMREKGAVVVGGSGGVLTLWHRDFWDDQIDRIIVDSGSTNPHADDGVRRRGMGESLDALAMVPDELARNHVVVGLGDGRLRIVDLPNRKVLKDISLRHDDIEGVVGLGFDVHNRLVSSGGTTVKVWAEDEARRKARENEEDADSDDSDDDSDEDSDDDGQDSKKRKKDDGWDSDDSWREKAHKRSKELQERSKKREKLGPYGAHGILGFDNL